MKELITKLLPASLIHRAQRFQLGLKLRPPYERMPFTFSDLPAPASGSAYASHPEKESPEYKRTMNKLLSFVAAGPIGPNKFWEYPWILSSLQVQPGMSLLDAGCGRAPLQYVLAELGVKVSAIDPNENVGWHGIDRRLAKKYGVNIDYRVEGMEKISYPDESFDRVMSVSVIEHCRAVRVKNDLVSPQVEPDRKLQGRMMQEMARVLKKGGLLLVTIDVLYPVGEAILEANLDVKNLIESSGLTLIGTVPKWGLYGYSNFDMQGLMSDKTVDVQDYTGVKGTSLGILLRK